MFYELVTQHHMAYGIGTMPATTVLGYMKQLHIFSIDFNKQFLVWYYVLLSKPGRIISFF